MPYKKGISGNPGGRPKLAADLKTRCRARTNEHVLRLEKIAKGKDDKLAMIAIEKLMAYGYGKPVQALEGTDGPAIRTEITDDDARAKILSQLALLSISNGTGTDPK